MDSTADSFRRTLSPLSTQALHMLHKEIRRVLRAEDSLPAQAERPYGIRRFPDFNIESDIIEELLRGRNEAFQPIVW